MYFYTYGFVPQKINIFQLSKDNNSLLFRHYIKKKILIIFVYQEKYRTLNTTLLKKNKKKIKQWKTDNYDTVSKQKTGFFFSIIICIDYWITYLLIVM